MENSISDHFVDGSSHRSRQNDNNGTDCSGESDGNPNRKLYQLVKEHSALCRAFLHEASSSVRHHQQSEHLLRKLESIWYHPKWAARVRAFQCFFSYAEFRKDVLEIVEFFEKELKRYRDETQTGQVISYPALTNLLPLIVPLVLKLLRAVHALWISYREDAMVTLPEELVEAARIMQNPAQINCLLVEIGELQDTDVAEFEENDIGQWLQRIRESGYNLLGLCAAIEGPSCKLLDISSVGDAIEEKLYCMEFRHVSKLIDLFILPLVKCCPCELLGEWILKLLLPLFSLCGYALCDTWFNLLNEGQGHDRLYLAHHFGYLGGSEESVKKLEGFLLLDSTRKASKLLGVLESMEPNDALMRVDLQPGSTVKTASSCDSKCAATNSVVGYTILHESFIRMLNMNLLGSWVDGEATMDALPFCHALVQVAAATKHGKLTRFIVDAMLPATIKLLCDDLPCAVQQTIRKLSCQLNPRKSKKATEDLWVLCEEIYKVFIQNQDFTTEDPDRENTGDRFKNWFSRQKEELLVKASCPIPADFLVNLWNWELEDELQRYLPTYVDMLYEADAMDCPKYEYPCQSTLFEKLRPEFRLKHGISNSLDDHVRMIRDMVHRKFPAAYSERHAHQMDKWLCKLISSKPYLTHSDERHSAMARLMEDLLISQHFLSPIDATLCQFDMQDAIDIFYNAILFHLEPQFHPLIREAQKDFLIKIAHQFNFAQEANSCKPLEPEFNDFPVYLQPYACSYIYRMKIESKYFEAIEHVRLQREFDQYLASGELDDDVNKFNSSHDKSVLQFC